MTKSKTTIEFRFYEIPRGRSALVLCGDKWIRSYGDAIYNLHFHNLLEIGICRYGSGEMFLNGEVCRYDSSAITIIPENLPHTTVSDKGHKCFWEYVFLDINRIVRELFPEDPLYQENVRRLLSRKSVLTSSDCDLPLSREIDSIIDEVKRKKRFGEKMADLHVNLLVYELIRRQGESESVDEHKEYKPSVNSNTGQVAEALSFIEKNYHTDIRVEELAALCNMSITHFRRVFSACMNVSPMDYVNLIRVQKACDMMKTGDDSMDSIAVRCGFNTTSTFNRNFKKYMGTSPYQWKIDLKRNHGENYILSTTARRGW